MRALMELAGGRFPGRLFLESASPAVFLVLPPVLSPPHHPAPKHAAAAPRPTHVSLFFPLRASGRSVTACAGASSTAAASFSPLALAPHPPLWHTASFPPFGLLRSRAPPARRARTPAAPCPALPFTPPGLAGSALMSTPLLCANAERRRAAVGPRPQSTFPARHVRARARARELCALSVCAPSFPSPFSIPPRPLWQQPLLFLAPLPSRPPLCFPPIKNLSSSSPHTAQQRVSACLSIPAVFGRRLFWSPCVRSGLSLVSPPPHQTPLVSSHPLLNAPFFLAPHSFPSRHTHTIKQQTTPLISLSYVGACAHADTTTHPPPPEKNGRRRRRRRRQRRGPSSPKAEKKHTQTDNTPPALLARFLLRHTLSIDLDIQCKTSPSFP